MNNKFNKERRSSKRRATSLSAVVKGQDGDDIFWKETGKLTTVSRNGASFKLNRECSIGRIIYLTMVMPKELRCYDHEEKVYSVWGVVQHCTHTSTEDYTGYHIGVAFIGKDCPKSFKKNCLTSYRISGLDEVGLWKVFEVERAFVVRQDTRFTLNLPINLKFVDSKKKILCNENTFTLNISRSGAAVITKCDFMVGDQIIFSCPEYNFYSKAIVCNQQNTYQAFSTLHLEFFENEFPTRALFPPLENKENNFGLTNNVMKVNSRSKMNKPNNT